MIVPIKFEIVITLSRFFVDQNILLILFLPIRLMSGVSYLSLEILDSEWYSILNKSLFKFIRTTPNSALNVAGIYKATHQTTYRLESP